MLCAVPPLLAEMAPTTSDQVLEAVDYVVLAGLSPRDAWLKAGQPNGEMGIQNIRKHARKRRAAAAIVASPESASPAASSASNAPGSSTLVECQFICASFW